jgi:hypothetical protein
MCIICYNVFTFGLKMNIYAMEKYIYVMGIVVMIWIIHNANGLAFK